VVAVEDECVVERDVLLEEHLEHHLGVCVCV
jgi:hypothetical protein